MNFTDGLQKLPLIPRSHFHHFSTSRVAPKRSFPKKGLQSPGSTHVKILHPAPAAESALSTATGRAATRLERWRGQCPHLRHPYTLPAESYRGSRLSSISALSVDKERAGGSHLHFNTKNKETQELTTLTQ